MTLTSRHRLNLKSSAARSPQISSGQTIFGILPTIWTLSTFLALVVPPRVPFPGQRFPGAAFDALLTQHVPRWFSTVPAAADALVCALERIGPAVLVSHSNGGLIALEAAWRRPDLIRGLVCVETSGFPESPPPRLDDKPVLILLGDFLDEVPVWRGIDAATGALSTTLSQAGAQVKEWRLPAMGVTGNSHMPMMDDNNETIAGMVTEWLDRTMQRGP